MPRIAPFAALPLLAVVVFGAAGGAAADSFARTAPYELFSGIEFDALCAEGAGAYTLDTAADLRGPHFSFSLECLFRDDAIPRDLAAGSADLEHVVPAQDGSEFLIAHVAAQSDHLSEHGVDIEQTTAWIQAGGKRLDLAGAPVPSQYLVLSVPVDEDAVLWVEDEGRAQGIDLRTGAQIDPVGAYYSDLALGTVTIGGFHTGKVDVHNEEGSGHLGCRQGFGEARRFIWDEDLGWAAEGEAFVEISFGWCTRSDAYTWELDRELSVTVDRAAPLSWTATELDEFWDLLVLVFAVPADTETITVDFTPHGEVEHEEAGPVAFSEELPHFTWTAGF